MWSTRLWNQRALGRVHVTWPPPEEWTDCHIALFLEYVPKTFLRFRALGVCPTSLKLTCTASQEGELGLDRGETHSVYVRKRPGVDEFLEAMGALFEAEPSRLGFEGTESRQAPGPQDSATVSEMHVACAFRLSRGSGRVELPPAGCCFHCLRGQVRESSDRCVGPAWVRGSGEQR